MNKKSLMFLFCIPLFCIPIFSREGEDRGLRIGGLVQSPIHLTLPDLLRFRQESISARQSVETGSGTAGRFQAVSLRNLIELAKAEEPIQELAISIKNNRGEQIVLAGGEILLEARSKFFVAGSTSASDSTLRDSLPALLVENKHGVYVALRQITFIEAISVARLISDLPASRKTAMPGSIKGTLIKTTSIAGYRLQTVLDQIALRPESTDILKFTARAGNTVAVSTEELKSEEGPVVVPRNDGRKHDLVFSGGGRRERLEEIEYIESISLKQKPMVYVVGVGCGDPNLLTNEAISIMAKADAFIGKEDYQKALAGYIAGKPVLFDPFMQLARYQKSKHPELTDAEAEKRANQVYADDMQMIRNTLAEGKIVALLEPGDPTLYGGWRNWLSGYIPQDQIRVIAGMSSFSVANALLGEYDLSKNPIIIAEPEQLKNNEPLIQLAAQKGNVLVIFMGLNRMKSLVLLLEKYFSPKTPVSIVYYAGIMGREHTLETSLSKAIEKTNDEKESFLGLIYVGQDLKRSELGK